MKTIPVIIILLFLIGCGSQDIPEYYEDVAKRTSALVKFDRTDLDIFDYRLKATLEAVIDVSNADTAHRITFSEIEIPNDENGGPLFKASVDFLDYQNFLNALENMLKMTGSSMVPLQFSASNLLDVCSDRETGMTLTDTAGVEFKVEAPNAGELAAFFTSARTLADQGPAENLPAKIAYIDSIKTAKELALKKKYRYHKLSLGKSTFKVAAGDAKTDRWQVDCKFSVYNPNAYDCNFLANFNLVGTKGGVIFSFKAEDFTVPAGKRQNFTAPTVLRKYQAERIGKVQTQISNVTTEDKMALKYME